MQDRFKFRLFNKAAKKFIYFDKAELLVDRENMGLLFRCDHLYLGNYEEPQFCTGMRDKNDKLIYEGDILKDMWGNPKPVKFKFGCFCWGMAEGTYWLSGSKRLEVIGNIYENPDLI